MNDDVRVFEYQPESRTPAHRWVFGRANPPEYWRGEEYEEASSYNTPEELATFLVHVRELTGPEKAAWLAKHPKPEER